MESQLITIDCGKNQLRLSIKMRISGEDLLFLIHGLGCAKENYDSIWDWRGLKDISIVALDLPGFGGSPGPEGFSYDLEEHADVCRCLLDRMPPGRVHILGHSMGGAIGIILAEKISDRLGSFINVEGNLIGQDCTVSRRRASVTFENFKNRQLPGMILTTALSDEPGRRLWSEFLKKADITGLYLSSRSLMRWSDSGMLLEKFRNMKCRKIYIYGDGNSSMPVLRRLGGIPLSRVPRSGHFPMNDNPDAFYGVIESFLSGDTTIQ